jgi:hypothetical protein
LNEFCIEKVTPIETRISTKLPAPLAVYTYVKNSSVSIVTGYGLDGWGSIPGRGKRFFYNPSVHTDPGATQSPVHWVPESSFPRGKAARA